MAKHRIERDSLGEVKVPAGAYYGAQTQRAVENFPVSGKRLPPLFIRAQGAVKMAAIRANRDLGLLDPGKVEAILRAAREVWEGDHTSEFVVDVYQSGAGTSQNMNANEVIANRALELLGKKRGDYSVIHPNDHVNMAQSTNDTIHVALKVSALLAIEEDLLPALAALEAALASKAREFDGICKSGRTHLQDAVPIRLGQEFSGYASIVSHGIRRVERAAEALRELNLGGTAVGTGLNAHPEFSSRAIQALSEITCREFREAENYFEATQNTDAAVEVSGALKTLAVGLGKIADDLRLLSSGPRTGLAEIRLPSVQPGSSIMPGKVNPVLAEMLNMVCYQVIGNDAAITAAAQAAQLELNVMMPVIAYNLLDSIAVLSGGVRAFTERCVRGIEADEGRCRELLERNLALATALNPRIGYSAAAKLAMEAYEKGKTIREVVLEKGILSEKEADEVLDPQRMTGKRK
jgi:fumarate hydratase class II